jgi:ABC-type polysaccharide transport system permease subunit
MNINKIFHITAPKLKQVTAILVARFIAFGNCVQRQFTTGIELIANADTGMNKTNITSVRILNRI